MERKAVWAWFLELFVIDVPGWVETQYAPGSLASPTICMGHCDLIVW